MSYVLELTNEQIGEWILLVKLQNVSRKWSVEGLSDEEAKKRQDALDDYPKVMMETEEGKAEMLAVMERIFYESDSENMGSLTGEDFWTWFEKFGEYHDTLEGIMGHWIMDKTAWDVFIDWYMKALGTNGRMTYDQFLGTFQIYQEKILPNLTEEEVPLEFCDELFSEPLELTDEQIAEWLQLISSQNATRKWSVEGLPEEEAKKRQQALLDYPKVMMETEDGKAQMMADWKTFFYESDSENMGSLTGKDFLTLVDKFGAQHDNVEGIQGHWIMDKMVWDYNMDWYMKTFGSGGRMTYDQWTATFPIYMEKILPHLKE